MSQKPETKISTDVQSWVINHGGKCVKFHGDPMGELGTPDIIGMIPVYVGRVVVGVPFAVELKLPGEEPTEIQKIQLMRWNNAGMHTAVIRSLPEFVLFIEEAAY